MFLRVLVRLRGKLDFWAFCMLRSLFGYVEVGFSCGCLCSLEEAFHIEQDV
jgi:hypothetical protein